MLCAIVLAAGRSRRMGSQKLLLPLGGQPIIVRVVDQVLRSPVDRVIVVVGQDGPRIAEALGSRPVQFVTNPETDGDMLSSVRCGLRALPENSAGALVVLGDQPGLTAEAIAGLVHAFRLDGRGIVVPTAGGRRGHPLLFGMRYRDEVLQRHDQAGLRGLLREHPDDVLEVAIPNSAVLEDLDEPADYQRLLERWGRGEETGCGGKD